MKSKIKSNYGFASLKAFLRAKAHKNRYFLGAKGKKAVFQRGKGEI
jgi:hypothetical protein